MKPYLPRKVSGNIDRITASTWNQLIDCLDFAMSHPRGDGVTVLNKAAGLLTAAGVAGGAMSAVAVEKYNSYFKLTLSSSTENNNTTYTVTIADGATGSDSIATLNGGTVYILPVYTEVVSAARVFFLKYTPAVYGSGGTLVSGAAMAISSVSGGILPSGGPAAGAYYMQLGRVVGSSGGVLSVAQDHTAGVADFRWYIGCR